MADPPTGRSRAEHADTTKEHSDIDSIEVSTRAPGTWGTSCRMAGTVGGVHWRGESDVDGESGMAFGEEV